MHRSKTIRNVRPLRLVIVVVMALGTLSRAMGKAQQALSPESSAATIQGTILDAAHHPVDGASVLLEQEHPSGTAKTTTNSAGVFTFSDLAAGTYRLSSQKAGLQSRTSDALVVVAGAQKHVELVLEAPSGSTSGASQSPGPTQSPMQFADQPNFTVAGVTDWTAAGGHGSDTTLRTSEDLTREAVVLKPANQTNSSLATAGDSSPAKESENRLRAALAREPESFAANHQLGELYLRQKRYSEAIPLLEAADRVNPADNGNEYDLSLACQGIGDFVKARDHAQKLLAQQDSADVHRLLASLDEETGDPLGAEREDEKAVRLDPSEQNYFQWGSELLLHRAVQPAVEVFREGAKAHPKSARMLAALGAALFAGGHDDEAALRLCDASDLNPADPAPYIFLGKIEVAAPSLLPCVQPTLARFAQQQPGNALANYYYAMVVWKEDKSAENAASLQQVEALLTKAVAIDPRFDEGYLQLGILYAARRDFVKAIDFYAKAIAINPQLSAAHYRLGMAYARTGDTARAKQEFQLYDQLDKEQAAAIEEQRREIKQFLVVLKVSPGAPSSN